MLRTLFALVGLAALAAPAAARSLEGEPAGIPWRPVLQTLVAMGLLVLLARRTEGETADDRRRARGRGLLSSLSSGRW